MRHRTAPHPLAVGGYDWKRAPKKPVSADPPTPSIKTCPWCGGLFEPTEDPTQIFCSKGHQRANQRRKRRTAQRQKKQDTRNRCGYCGEVFERTNEDQQYCSRLHKQKASVKRAKEQKRAESRAEHRRLMA